MNKLPLRLSAMVGGLLCVSLAQMLSPTAKAQSVAIIQQPNLESAYRRHSYSQMDHHDPSRIRRTFCCRTIWHDFQWADPDGEIARQDQRGPLRHDIPCPHRRPAATDDLLLQGDFNRGVTVRAMAWRATSTSSPPRHLASGS